MVVSSLILFQLFATGDVDFGGKLTPGVVDTSGKFATDIVNTGVVHLDLQIPLQIFENY
jgi:hypothetical protein